MSMPGFLVEADGFTGLLAFQPPGADQHRIAFGGRHTGLGSGLLQLGQADAVAIRHRGATQAHDVEQYSAGKDRRHLVDAATRGTGRAAGAVAGETIVQLVVVPGVAQRIDMRADMQRQQDRVLGDLEATGAAGAGGIVAAVAVHEMQHARALRRDRRAARKRLGQAEHLSGPHQRGGGAYLRRPDAIQRAALVLGTPEAPGFLASCRCRLA